MQLGKKVPASLEHVAIYPPEPMETYPTIIALHGRGTNEHDLLPLVKSLGLENVLVISPRAPLRLDLGFGIGFTWYELGQEGTPESSTFMSSLETLRRFLDEMRNAYPIDPQRLILLGFSQGTVMAYASVLREPDEFAGIAALSGYIPLRSGLALQLTNLDDLSVFISHGIFDEIISVRFAQEAFETLKAGGARVVYREYAMGHEVHQEP